MNEKYTIVTRCPVCYDARIRITTDLRPPRCDQYWAHGHDSPKGPLVPMPELEVVSIRTVRWPIIHHTASPHPNYYLDETHLFTKEKPMSQQAPQDVFGTVIASFAHQINADIAERNKTAETAFRELDVQSGDRVRLTELARRAARISSQVVKHDGSVLEGRVLDVKIKDGKSQLRIAGFDHTGGNAGGQHVWFPIDAYKIEVLHKAYRLTDEDRLFAELTGLSEVEWKNLTDERRECYRRNFAKRAEKIKKILQPGE